ncbi:MAG: DUF6268 family outer membrane beta-barrel protein [Phycisphaerales bacterium]
MPRAQACLACTAFLLLTSVAGAQEQPTPTQSASEPLAEDQAEASQPAGPPRFIYTLAQRFEATSVPHIDGGGDATSTLTRTEFDVVWFASRRTRALFQFSNEFAFYEFQGAFGLDPADGNPVANFNRQNIDVLVTHNLDRQWSMLVLGGIGLARERNADVGDSIVWRAGVGTAYQATENISIGVSLVATAEQEGSVEFLPLPVIDATLELDERWTLRLGTLAGAVLTYQMNDELAFRLRSGYNERNYRLDDEGFAPEGVFQDKSIDLRLGVNWQPVPGLEIDAGVGSQLWRRFKVKDEDGNRLRRAETDPTFMLFAGVSYRF